jgi:AAA+ superfamily predicted ATPase
MSLMTPPTIELTYQLTPDVLKPNIELQGKLAQLVKREAMGRFSRGEGITFTIDVAGLFKIDVAPSDKSLPLPRKGGRAEFLVRRTQQHGSQALGKQVDDLLPSEITYPSQVWQERFEELVGLNAIKKRVLTMLELLFSDRLVREWAQKHHCPIPANLLLKKRYPLFIFEGSYGVGKTELAHAIGDPLARRLGTPVLSYSVGLQVRGEGLVGQLSRNIRTIFEFARHRHLECGVPILLVVDEADAIGQDRDGQQAQHHEESAGVSTLLQQIDILRESPGVALLFTTNRHAALDGAVKSRSSTQVVSFPLPRYGDRFLLLKRSVGTLFATADLKMLASATDGMSPRDIVQLIDSALIEAIGAKKPLTKEHLLRAVSLMSHLHPSKRHVESDFEKSGTQLLGTVHPNHVNGQNGQKVAA